MFSEVQKRYLQMIGLQLSLAQAQQCQDFMALLGQWNQAFNLTAITEPKHMISHHFLDSLAISPYLHGNTIMDVGSGAGFPGLPLAICHPNRQFCLADSHRKKTAFLRQVVFALGLCNVEVLHARVESASFNSTLSPFTTLISRAFSDINTFVTLSQQHCAANGKFLAMKGQYPSEELTGLATTISIQEVVKLLIPGLDAQRHLVILQKTVTNEVQSSNLQLASRKQRD